MAFSIFHQKHPDSMLYLHTDFLGFGGTGWNLLKMLAALGIPKDAVTFPAVNDYRYGLSREDLAGFYTAMDVLLAVSYGEGFGVPTIEAQACGTRVIGSSWAATPDLLSEDCWMIDGTMMWDAGQDAFWMTPNVSSIVSALELAYEADRGRSQVSIDFAKQFDVETVWQKHWLPTLKKLLQ
jgi:glycosyltransferase involved in cell wall biosynthesis